MYIAKPENTQRVICCLFTAIYTCAIVPPLFCLFSTKQTVYTKVVFLHSIIPLCSSISTLSGIYNNFDKFRVQFGQILIDLMEKLHF